MATKTITHPTALCINLDATPTIQSVIGTAGAALMRVGNFRTHEIIELLQRARAAAQVDDLYALSVLHEAGIRFSHSGKPYVVQLGKGM